ncbi:LysE family translocator [Zooshikella sp. RANM57]|uniref:LysE family translocator n=1 Tax=Zooshikella sp. RANM57 TaxID=3425863 RepID=UPI003D6EEC4C
MSSELLTSFCVIVGLGVMLPGPNGLLIVTNAIVHGRKTAFVTLLGTLCGFYVHGLCSVIGISALIMGSAEIFIVVKTLGVVYLIYLGMTSLLQALKPSPQNNKLSFIQKRKQHKSFCSAWVQGFTTNILNPKVSMFYLALFPQFLVDVADIVTTTLFLVSLQVIIVGIWFTCVALVAAKAMGGDRPLFTRLIKGVMGSLMLWFGFNLANVKA